MMRKGMTAGCGAHAAMRLAALRNVETFKRFHFHNVLRMLRSKERYQVDGDSAKSETKAEAMGKMFDTAIMTASAVDIDKKLLNSGGKQLCLFRLELTKRFNSVYDAWIYYDMDGDGSMSKKEFVSLCRPLRLPKELLPTDIFALIDTDQNKEIKPLTFVRVLKWHSTPGSDKDMQQMLDTARDKRSEIFKTATRRTAEQNQDSDSRIIVNTTIINTWMLKS